LSYGAIFSNISCEDISKLYKLKVK